jgi:hypothetical protein
MRLTLVLLKPRMGCKELADAKAVADGCPWSGATSKVPENG